MMSKNLCLVDDLKQTNKQTINGSEMSHSLYKPIQIEIRNYQLRFSNELVAHPLCAHIEIVVDLKRRD